MSESESYRAKINRLLKYAWYAFWTPLIVLACGHGVNEQLRSWGIVQTPHGNFSDLLYGLLGVAGVCALYVVVYLFYVSWIHHSTKHRWWL